MTVDKKHARLSALFTASEIAALVAILGGIAFAIGVTVTERIPDGGGATPPVPEEAIALDGLPTLGTASAPVVMVLYSDFECPFCARFVAGGVLSVVHRHLPLPSHAGARRLSEAAECAHEQGGFWAMHDALFADPTLRTDNTLAGLAQLIRLNGERFQECIGKDQHERVDRDVESAMLLRVRSTPTAIVGRRRADGRMQPTEVLVGARPLAAFTAAIERALK
jgi:protein-disulfide isomerase